jgi:FkbM family methyltransferase
MKKIKTIIKNIFPFLSPLLRKIDVKYRNELARRGYEIKSYPSTDLKRRMSLVNHFKINKVFDIGASTGNYALTMRKFGFEGEIISFEPLSKSFNILKQNANNDKNWKAINIALGNSDEETYINIAGNFDSSSLLEMLPDHLNSAPESLYLGKEKIKINKLDTIFNKYYKKDDCVYIKIDTQGFEKQVLEGAEKSLTTIKGLQLEMSIIPLYEGGILFLEMISFLNSNGFDLYSIENGFYDKDTGQLLQFDGIFFKK